MVTVVVLTVVMVFMLILVLVFMLILVLVFMLILVLGKGDKLVVDVSKLLGSIMAALDTDITLGKGIV